MLTGQLADCESHDAAGSRTLRGFWVTHVVSGRRSLMSSKMTTESE
jgi:hypothetical protein